MHDLIGAGGRHQFNVGQRVAGAGDFHRRAYERQQQQQHQHQRRNNDGGGGDDTQDDLDDDEDDLADGRDSMDVMMHDDDDNDEEEEDDGNHDGEDADGNGTNNDGEMGERRSRLKTSDTMEANLINDELKYGAGHRSLDSNPVESQSEWSDDEGREEATGECC